MSVGDPRRRGISSKNVIGIHGLQWQQALTSDVAASFVWRLRVGFSLLLRSANVWSVLKMFYKDGKVGLRMPSASRGCPGAPKAATIRSLSSLKILRLAFAGSGGLRDPLISDLWPPSLYIIYYRLANDVLTRN